MDGGDTRTTKDLAVAAYVYLQGLKITRAVRLKGSYEFEFAFKDPEDKFDQLVLDFANSDCHRYDSAVRTLKKLCNRRPGQQRARG